MARRLSSSIFRAQNQKNWEVEEGSITMEQLLELKVIAPQSLPQEKNYFAHKHIGRKL
jgi:hypothetical protein